MLPVILLLLCIICFTFKSLFNKMFAQSFKGAPGTATPVFALITGLGCAVATFIYNGFRFEPNTVTWVLGLINGVVLFLFNLSVINASVTGPYSFQSLMSTSGNIILPLLFTSLWCHESLSFTAWAGIIVMLISFVLFNARSLNLSGAKKGYFFWVTLLFVSNGVYGIMLDAQQRATANTLRNEMIMITFLMCAVISICYLLFVRRGDLAPAFAMGKKAWIESIGTSLVYALATNLMMIVIGLMPAAIMYTALNGGVLICSVLLGAAVFREKLDVFKCIGLATAVVALALLKL